MPGNSAKPPHFLSVAQNLFQNLVSDYHYVVANTELRVNIAPLVYHNPRLNKRIEIKNETFGVDYGFSIFVWNTSIGEYNIIYNVPHEKQDLNGHFLINAFKEIFSSRELVDLISTDRWVRFGRIYFQN